MAYVSLFLTLLLSGVSSDSKDKDIFNFHQSDYHIEGERTELVSYNKEYIKHFEIRNFKYNRTTPAFNLTLTSKVDLGKNLMLVLQVYKFLSNEYRYFPIRLQINLCDCLEKNLMGLNLHAQCGNFSECPLKKNKTYQLCKWTLDEARYPPLMPTGRYMGEFQGLYNGVEAFVLRGYVTITRPLEK